MGQPRRHAVVSGRENVVVLVHQDAAHTPPTTRSARGDEQGHEQKVRVDVRPGQALQPTYKLRALVHDGTSVTVLVSRSFASYAVSSGTSITPTVRRSASTIRFAIS